MRTRRLDVLFFAFVTSAACASDRVEGVSAGFIGTGIPESAMFVGDNARLLAIGVTAGWPSRVKYDSKIEPHDFQWSSSLTSVATIDAAGLVTATGAGTTFLTASAENVESMPVVLYVTPTVTALRIVASRLELRVGDTLDAVLEGIGPFGESIDGVRTIFQWRLYGALESLAGNDWGLSPITSRFIARQPGVVELSSEGIHAIRGFEPRTDTTRVTILPAVGALKR